MRNLVLGAATCGIMLLSANSFAGENANWLSNLFNRLNISATFGIDGTNASTKGIDGTNGSDGASTMGIDGTNLLGIDGTNGKGNSGDR